MSYMTHDFIGTTEAARLLGKSPATIRRMIEAGELKPAARAPGGFRPAYLFNRADVEALAAA